MIARVRNWSAEALKFVSKEFEAPRERRVWESVILQSYQGCPQKN
jgi:hypothetical protein